MQSFRRFKLAEIGANLLGGVEQDCKKLGMPDNALSYTPVRDMVSRIATLNESLSLVQVGPQRNVNLGLAGSQYQATLHERDKEYPEAITTLKQGIAFEEKASAHGHRDYLAMAYYYLGHLYRVVKNFTAARQSLLKAIDLDIKGGSKLDYKDVALVLSQCDARHHGIDPENVAAEILSGDSIVVKVTSASDQGGDSYTQKIALHPYNARNYLQRAIARLDQAGTNRELFAKYADEILNDLHVVWWLCETKVNTDTKLQVNGEHYVALRKFYLAKRIVGLDSKDDCLSKGSAHHERFINCLKPKKREGENVKYSKQLEELGDECFKSRKFKDAERYYLAANGWTPCSRIAGKIQQAQAVKFRQKPNETKDQGRTLQPHGVDLQEVKQSQDDKDQAKEAVERFQSGLQSLATKQYMYGKLFLSSAIVKDSDAVCEYISSRGTDQPHQHILEMLQACEALDILQAPVSEANPQDRLRSAEKDALLAAGEGAEAFRLYESKEYSQAEIRYSRLIAQVLVPHPYYLMRYKCVISEIKRLKKVTMEMLKTAFTDKNTLSWLYDSNAYLKLVDDRDIAPTVTEILSQTRTFYLLLKLHNNGSIANLYAEANVPQSDFLVRAQQTHDELLEKVCHLDQAKVDQEKSRLNEEFSAELVAMSEDAYDMHLYPCGLELLQLAYHITPTKQIKDRINGLKFYIESIEYVHTARDAQSVYNVPAAVREHGVILSIKNQEKLSEDERTSYMHHVYTLYLAQCNPRMDWQKVSEIAKPLVEELLAAGQDSIRMLSAFGKFIQDYPEVNLSYLIYYYRATAYEAIATTDKTAKGIAIYINDAIKCLNRAIAIAEAFPVSKNLDLASAHYYRSCLYATYAVTVGPSESKQWFRYARVDLHLVMALDNQGKSFADPTILLQALSVCEASIYDVEPLSATDRAVLAIRADREFHGKNYKESISLYTQLIGLLQSGWGKQFAAHFFLYRAECHRQLAADDGVDWVSKSESVKAILSDLNVCIWILQCLDVKSKIFPLVNPYSMRVAIHLAKLSSAMSDELSVKEILLRKICADYNAALKRLSFNSESDKSDYRREAHLKLCEAGSQYLKHFEQSSSQSSLRFAKTIFEKANELLVGPEEEAIGIIKKIDAMLSDAVAARQSQAAIKNSKPKSAHITPAKPVRTDAEEIKLAMEDMIVRIEAEDKEVEAGVRGAINYILFEIEKEQNRTEKERKQTAEKEEKLKNQKAYQEMVKEMRAKKNYRAEDIADAEESTEEGEDVVDEAELPQQQPKDKKPAKLSRRQAKSRVPGRVESNDDKEEVVAVKAVDWFAQWSIFQQKNRNAALAKAKEEKRSGNKKTKIKKKSAVPAKPTDPLILRMLSCELEGVKVELSDFEKNCMSAIENFPGHDGIVALCGSQARDRAWENELKLEVAELDIRAADYDFQTGCPVEQIEPAMRKHFGEAIVSCEQSVHDPQLVRLVIKDGKTEKQVDVRHNPHLKKSEPNFLDASHQCDTTISAIMITSDGKMHDGTGEKGECLQDLQDGIIRTVVPDPAISLEQDPVRILRIIKQLADLSREDVIVKTGKHFKLADGLPEAIIDCTYYLLDNPGQTNAWLKKIFFHSNHEQTIQLMLDLGVFKQLFPEFTPLLENENFYNKFCKFIASIKNRNTSLSMIYDYLLGAVMPAQAGIQGAPGSVMPAQAGIQGAPGSVMPAKAGIQCANVDTITRNNKLLNEHYSFVEDFSKDPLRILREIYRAANFNLRLQPRVVNAMQAHVHLLGNFPRETDSQLKKLFAHSNREVVDYYLANSGVSTFMMRGVTPPAPAKQATNPNILFNQQKPQGKIYKPLSAGAAAFVPRV